jgi:hypothetical protein
MSSRGELCIRFEGQKYLAWAKAYKLEFDKPYVGGIFKNNNGSFVPLVQDGETYLHKNKKDFVTMLLMVVGLKNVITLKQKRFCYNVITFFRPTTISNRRFCLLCRF